MDFIARLGDPDLARAMFGDDFFERQTGNAVAYYADPEHRSVKVIGRLLSATGAKWVGDVVREAGPRGDVHKAAGMLLSLAKRIPDSSYAPYAAYYAGCCYAAMCLERAQQAIRVRDRQGGFESDLALGRYRAAQLRQNPDLARAYEAFALAARRADDYVKPRVLYQQGSLYRSTFELDQAERLLMQAARAVPGESTLKEWFAKDFGGLDVHTYMEKARARLEAARAARSDTPKR